MENEPDLKLKAGETLRTEGLGMPDVFPTGIDAFNTFREQAETKFEVAKDLIPGFEIISELGRGAFGVVYQARDVHLDRMVAIKISLIDDPRLWQGYIKEAKNAAKLECPGIVPVYQVGTLESGRPFVVQRFIEGGSLRSRLNKMGSLDFLETCTLVIEVARAVAKAHAAGLVHRDIKPDNILIDSHGKPWLADFGLALPENEQRKHRGEKAGTPLYMSPEQLLGRADWLDGRSDIYALGVMMYEMLIGRPPFYAKDFDELREQILNRDAKPISQRSPNIPAVMDIIYENCCAKKVQQRYSNAYELAGDLEAAIQENPPYDTQVAAVSRSTVPSRMSVNSRVTRRVSQRSTLATQRGLVQESLLAEKKRNWYVPIAIVGALFLIAGMAYSIVNRSSAIVKKEDRPEVVIPPVPDVDAKPTEVKLPARPLRVSKGSQGTHTSIQAAIEDAAEGETIFILPGQYKESISLNKPVKLEGEGKLEDILIVGENAPALIIANSDLSQPISLVNLSLEGAKTEDKDFNTVELTSGSLELQGCSLKTRSFDCIKAYNGSSVIAKETTFRSTGHPAISIESASKFIIDNCDFDIEPLTKNAPIANGIQAKNCSGHINSSRFRGNGPATGIHWQLSSDLVLIENNTFENCDTAIFVDQCKEVRIVGNLELPMILGCNRGIVSNDTGLTLDALRIIGNGGIMGVGVSGNPTSPVVEFHKAIIEGFKHGLKISTIEMNAKDLHVGICETGIGMAKAARLTLQSSSLNECEETGIHLQDAILQMESCSLEANGNGVLVDGKSQFECLDTTIKGSNSVGVLVFSGTATLRAGSKLDGNLAGIAVLDLPGLNNADLESKKELPRIEINGAVITELASSKLKTAKQQSECMLIVKPCIFKVTNSKLSKQPTIAPQLSSEVQDGWTVVGTK
jgi:serine/threonine protein kinase